jgi:hypothetical protein
VNNPTGSLLSHASQSGVFESWKQENYLERWAKRPPVEDPRIGTAMIGDCALPRQTEAFTSSEFIPCPEVRFVEYKTADRVSKPPQHVTAYLVTNVPMYAAARTPKTEMAAIKYRILQKPPGNPKTANKMWSKVPDIMLRNQYAPIDRDIAWPVYEKHLESASRRARAQQAQEEVTSNGYNPSDYCFSHASMFVKTNEVLMRFERREDGLLYAAFKPRAIINFRPKAIDSVGPCVFEAAKRLKEEHNYHNPPTFQNAKVLIRITYGSALDADQLSAWMENAKHWVERGGKKRRYWAVVAGDDGLIITYWNGALLFIETDFSQFDASEGVGALAYERRQLYRLGIPETDLECMKRQALAIIKSSLGKIKPGKRGRRQTGESKTTLGNGLVHEGALLYGLSDGNEWKLDERYLELGLKVKMLITRDLAKISFLKGWWLPSNEGTLVWTVLPSRVLKVGKHLGDVRHIKGFSKNLWIASEQHASAVAKTYNAFSWSPIIGAYVWRWKDVHDVRPWVLEPWKVRAGKKVGILMDEAYAMASRRYDVPVTAIHKVEQMYRGAGVMTFLMHPVFLRMALTDY